MWGDNLINDPFDISSSFLNFITSWSKSSDKFEDMFSKLEGEINSNILKFIQSENSVSENKFEKDIISQVKKNTKLARQNFIAISNCIDDLITKVPETCDNEKNRYKFWSRQILSSIAPSNFFWTNPSAVQRFIKTEGDSLKNGVENWLDDLSDDKMVSCTNKNLFKVGENIAITKGKVVFKNELFELIQYESLTKKNYKVPIVMIQPWINKYYIFDLNKNLSFVDYLTNQGFTVFITSWKNPDESLREINFEDYLFKGLLEAIDVANEICKTEQAHVSGYCIGGTALTALMGTIKNNNLKNPVLDISLFASLTDFSSPGDISFFITKKSFDEISEIVKNLGYLKSGYISQTFRMLKPESLIWPYYANNYLNGAKPPASDLLYWNSDSTNLPENMCLFYIEEFYINNNLINKGCLNFNNYPCDISKIDQPIYAVGAEQDHIAPWKETFKICNLTSSDTRFVLTSEGHIAGFVNPPSKNSRKKFSIINNNDINDKLIQNTGSWWSDWIEWLKSQDNHKISSRKTGSKKHPSLYDAPGNYVFE